VYFAVSVSLPTASAPAEIVMVAEPAVSVVELEVYAPLERTTDPVGVAPVPATPTVTLRLCAVVTLAAAGVTVTVGVVTACVTVTGDADVPEALLYVAELFASGVYFAVSVSLPTASAPAAIVMVAEPAVSVVALEVYAPLERTTDPVGVAPAPVTASETLRLCAVVTLAAAGVTVTVGVVTTTVTVTGDADAPEAPVYVVELFASGVYFAVSVSLPTASAPAAIVIVAEPAVSVVAPEV